MSGSYMNESNSSSLNQGAAHETGLYDPSMHDNQIVALYDTRAHAGAAREKLLAAGVDSASVQVMDKGADEMAGGVDYEAGNQGLWGSIKSLFMPDEDAHAYSHAVGAGHAMVVVTPNAKSDRNHIIQTLEGTNPLDFDAKLEEWRQSGYNYTPASTAAGGMADTAGAAAAPGAAPMASTAATGGAATAGAAAAGAVTSGAATMGNAAAPRAPATGASVAGGTARTGESETIKVMEERLRVGKREVAGGAVRVRSYVVERPVEEQVRLHEERVSVERHPVDRAVTGAEASAFQERTIEARATSEEAVVGKEARVVEEIGIRKEASDRTETVRDTVRSTKVDVEDGTKAGPGAATTKPTGPAATTGTTTTGPSSSGSMGTGGATPNSTPGATTSGMNTPRK